MKNVVLVGFPASGKTTIGRSLAPQLGLNFVDLDTAIEVKYHTTVPQLFKKYGELVFRKCEYETLSELLLQENLLISTGGGAPCFKDAMALINKHSASVYLKLEEATLVERLKASHKKRPLTDNLNTTELSNYVHQTLMERSPYYEQAHLTFIESDINDLHALKEQLLKKTRV